MECDEMHKKNAKNFQVMKDYVERFIIKNLEVDDTQSMKAIEEIRSQIIKIKKNTIKLNILYQKKLTKLGSIINSLVAASKEKIRKGQKDYYKKILRITSIGNDLAQNQRDLGNEVIKFWQTLLKCEKNRMTYIKNAFSGYYMKQIEVFGKNVTVDIPNKILETFNPD